MHLRPFTAFYPRMELVPSAGEFFNSVKERYPEYRAEGFFQRIPRESLFIYEISGTAGRFRGVIAGAEIRDYLDGSIRRHEFTLAGKENQQLELLRERGAAIKPVLLTYRESGAITNWIQEHVNCHEPFFRVILDGDEHRLWAIDDPLQSEALRHLFAGQVPVAYIADGHHRAACMAQLFEQADDERQRVRFGLLPCAFFPDTDVVIHGFNRVVEAQAGLTPDRFMDLIAEKFDIEILDVPRLPRQKFEILMFVHQGWYLLRWKPFILEGFAPAEVVLDSVLLNERVLGDILGIRNVRNDRRVDYVEGARGVEGIRQQVAGKEFAIGFCLFPVMPDEFMALADQGKVLPPKSTWFEPRMKNGLVVYEFGA